MKSKKKKDLEEVEESQKIETQNNEEIAGPDLEAKCVEFESGWKRALADYENLQKDMHSQLRVSRDRIKIDFVGKLLPVLDNFNQAVNFAPKTENPEIENWLLGVTFIQKQFETVLSEMGVEMVGAVGQFNPTLHEAVGLKTDDSKADQEIIEVIQPGWKIGDIV
ncbi:nucleotide exchange factor GrpE, partial [Candidatus Uhrbacteria bacterium CG_4_10_14_0_2_um_filter_41_7]